jgi:dTDP-4-amino-4,6-dideoxygalactose transaminase
MAIPLVDLRAQYISIKPEIDAAIAGVLESAQFINGREVALFEEEFAAYCGVKHAIGVGNGTDALSLALTSLGVGPGDEVVTAVNTFTATAEAISSVGAVPVFVDVDPVHYTMDTQALEAAITPCTAAIIPVHLYGQPSQMEEICSIAGRYGLYVVEDAAQAHGASYRGRPMGSWGHMACFSFYPGKNLGAYGDAGAVVTNDQELADKVRMLHDHGRANKYVHETIGMNSRMDTLQAAVLRVKLGHLPEWTFQRRQLATLYSAALAEIEWAIPPQEMDGGSHAYHLYVIQSEHRDALRDHLDAEGIATGIHYPLPLHLQPAYRHLGYHEGQFPVAESLANRMLSLPMYPELPESAITQIVASIGAFGPHVRLFPAMSRVS